MYFFKVVYGDEELKVFIGLFFSWLLERIFQKGFNQYLGEKKMLIVLCFRKKKLLEGFWFLKFQKDSLKNGDKIDRRKVESLEFMSLKIYD